GQLGCQLGGDGLGHQPRQRGGGRRQSGVERGGGVGVPGEQGVEPGQLGVELACGVDGAGGCGGERGQGRVEYGRVGDDAGGGGARGGQGDAERGWYELGQRAAAVAGCAVPDGAGGVAVEVVEQVRSGLDEDHG